MDETCEPAVLGVCLENTLDAPFTSFLHADSARRAIELLRLMRFDLLLTSDRLPDMPLSTFINRVKRAWPWQRWVLVADEVGHRQELLARTLGVTAILDTRLNWEQLLEIAEHLRRRHSVPSVGVLISTRTPRALSGSPTG
jgi:DNA-binding NarL/FixJ family response regulator